VDPYDAFTDQMRDLVAGHRMADAAVLTKKFWTEPFTGRWFHQIADSAHPNVITADDLVAVSTLGVTIPAGVAIWLRSSEGCATVSDLLREVPADVDIWDGAEHLVEDGPLWRLWRVLETACWPKHLVGNGMGRTKISKVMAAKRPRLVPIDDSVVRGLFNPVPNWWEAFRRALADTDLRVELSIASAAGAPEDVTLLRRLDVLLWMIGQQPDW
jgi:hypothetical protein